MVGLCGHNAVFIAQGVVCFAAALVGKGKAVTEFHALDSGNGKQNVRKNALHRVEPRLADARRQPDDRRFEHAADAVAVRTCRRDRLLHAFARFVTKRGKGLFGKRFDVGFEIAECAIAHTGTAGKVRADPNALFLQRRVTDGARRDKCRRDAAGEMPAAARVLKSVIFAPGGIVRMRGAHHRFHRGIVAAFRVAVFDEQRQRCAGRDPVNDPADDLHLVGFVPCRGNVAARRAQKQHAANVVRIHRHPRRQPVQRCADIRPVALPEKGDGERVSEGVFHTHPSNRP